jgi:hypothetical protein
VCVQGGAQFAEDGADRQVGKVHRTITVGGAGSGKPDGPMVGRNEASHAPPAT